VPVYNDTTFDAFKDANGDYSDNKNPFAPEYTFNAGVIYRHGNGFFLAADMIGYGSFIQIRRIRTDAAPMNWSMLK